MAIKKYGSDAAYSYTLGMALTVELIRLRPEAVIKIYIHPDYMAKDADQNIFKMCGRTQFAPDGLPWEVNRKIFNRLATKENTFVIGLFEKYRAPVSDTVPHVVLVNPSDAGNLGAIIRTGVGFGFLDFVIIRPGVDIHDPRTIRASMGAFFHGRHMYFGSFEEYSAEFPKHKPFCFMLNGRLDLADITERPRGLFSMVFGNEAAGLPDGFLDYGESVRIQHNHEIDSLNLAVAAGIAMYKFAGL
ncbi:MAG: TrmH family RNA methyltransferase [Clostridiales bacterium]|jgi:TrmH family RNA methyltransferase|nr:TrmH family RNA methyltransferase [Clostridiales bacterium]